MLWAAYTAPYNCRSRDERFAGTPPVAGLPDAVDAPSNKGLPSLPEAAATAL